MHDLTYRHHIHAPVFRIFGVVLKDMNSRIMHVLLFTQIYRFLRKAKSSAPAGFNLNENDHSFLTVILLHDQVDLAERGMYIAPNLNQPLPGKVLGSNILTPAADTLLVGRLWWVTLSFFGHSMLHLLRKSELNTRFWSRHG